MAASDKMHGVAKYDILTGKQSKPKAHGELSPAQAAYIPYNLPAGS